MARNQPNLCIWAGELEVCEQHLIVGSDVPASIIDDPRRIIQEVIWWSLTSGSGKSNSIWAHKALFYGVVDCDSYAAQTYAMNYSKIEVIKEAKEAAYLHTVRMDMESVSPVYQCDIRAGWWCQFAPRIDLLMQSPPCPAWSLAHVAHGLSRADGFMVIESLLKTTLLQPEVVAFENVANFKMHSYFAIVSEVIRWLGWEIRWHSRVNLADILPHQRERFLMVLTAVEHALKPDFRFVPWRPRSNVNLQSCDILRPRECLSHQHVPDLSSETLRVYLHPEFVPGERRDVAKAAKAYRLRNATQVCSCVMAQYGFAHELGIEVVRKGGLWGNLIIDHDIIRWLSVPEICSLLGIMYPWRITLDIQRAFHVFGNAIAVPHALLS